MAAHDEAILVVGRGSGRPARRLRRRWRRRRYAAHGWRSNPNACTNIVSVANADIVSVADANIVSVANAHPIAIADANSVSVANADCFAIVERDAEFEPLWMQ